MFFFVCLFFKFLCVFFLHIHFGSASIKMLESRKKQFEEDGAASTVDTGSE